MSDMTEDFLRKKNPGVSEKLNTSETARYIWLLFCSLFLYQINQLKTVWTGPGGYPARLIPTSGTMLTDMASMIVAPLALENRDDWGEQLQQLCQPEEVAGGLKSVSREEFFSFLKDNASAGGYVQNGFFVSDWVGANLTNYHSRRKTVASFQI